MQLVGSLRYNIAQAIKGMGVARVTRATSRRKFDSYMVPQC